MPESRPNTGITFCAWFRLQTRRPLSLKTRMIASESPLVGHMIKPPQEAKVSPDNAFFHRNEAPVGKLRLYGEPWCVSTRVLTHHSSPSTGEARWQNRL